MTTKPNKTRSFAALFLLFVFAAYIAVGAVTYSRFIDGFVGESAADVAQGVAYYGRGSLYYNGEELAYSRESDEMVISAIAPGETIDYYFSVSDIDALTLARNEVLLQVRVIFSVRLELLLENEDGTNTTQTLYFSARDAENTGYLQHGQCSLSTVSNAGSGSGGTLNTIVPPSSADADTGIDYMTDENDLTNNRLHTETAGDGDEAVHEHMTGMYLRPSGSSTAQEYNFLLRVVLPSQTDTLTNYVDARVVVDVRIEAEQITEIPQAFAA